MNKKEWVNNSKIFFTITLVFVVCCFFMATSLWAETVGNTTVFGSISYSNKLRAMPFTMPENGDITSVTMYHSGGSGTMVLCVYDGEGAPQNRLAATPATAVSGSTGWQTINLTSTVFVSSGSTVWLAWCYFGNNPGIRYQTGSPGRAEADDDCVVCGCPDPFGPSTQKNYIYSIYATYTPTGGPTPGIVGNTTVFGSTSYSPNRRAMPFTMPEDGTINSVTMYHSGGSGSMILAVYNGEFNPQCLLAKTRTTVVSSSTGWQTIDLISPAYVAGGDTFWLAWVYESNPGIRYQTGSPGAFVYVSGGSFGMHDHFGCSEPENYIYSIYAQYSPGGEPTYKTVGNTEIFGNTSISDHLRAQPCTMPEDGRIECVAMYHNGGSGLMCFGVYDGEGSPQNKLAGTDINDVCSTPGWQPINLTSPLYVTGGVTVWLAWCYESNPGIRYQTGTPGRADAGVKCVCPLPDPFGPSTQAPYIYSIFARYTID